MCLNLLARIGRIPRLPRQCLISRGTGHPRQLPWTPRTPRGPYRCRGLPAGFEVVQFGGDRGEWLTGTLRLLQDGARKRLVRVKPGFLHQPGKSDYRVAAMRKTGGAGTG